MQVAAIALHSEKDCSLQHYKKSELPKTSSYLLNQAIRAAKQNRILVVAPKKKVGEGKWSKNSIDVAEDPDALRTRITAILALLETFPKEEMRKLVMELLRRSVKRWRALDERETASSHFVTTVDDTINRVNRVKSVDDTETEKITAQYMMGAIVELYLSDDEELEGESMLCVVDVCDVILSAVCSKLANRFERKRRLDLAIEEAEEVAVDMRSVELAIGVIGRVMFTARNDPEVSGGFGLRGQFEGEEQRLSTRRVGSGGRLEKITSTMKRLIRIVESNPKHCPQELKLLSGSVGTLVESMEGQSTTNSSCIFVISMTRRKPSMATPSSCSPGGCVNARSHRSDLIYQKILTQLNDADSYVFLASIGALAEFLLANEALPRQGRRGSERRSGRCSASSETSSKPAYFRKMVGYK
ncbi:hypothetical protein QR680_008210 [Steinernema hermaphroditum]|uniref:Uncharacterized protein n=1 Tax=Steinernema hermaphroditum TaxID=289476 RepID=A0AA39M7P9_9BILA|nr:hypothetical protein QR680_008210 [Steinernema hermaphroditum]